LFGVKPWLLKLYWYEPFPPLGTAAVTVAA
jgi:hypothetical protein